MKSSYKRLGNYIEEVNIINTHLGEDSLKGISSIYKCFMTSRANTVGVDFTDYKIVEKGQFAYNPNTARMGDKIPIALNDSNTCIVSKIYPVFKVVDENQLLPDYLMMWFRRPEFDRYARFKSHGSAREIFDWEEMRGVELPVPHIDKQREIVKEYNTILQRIDLNNALIQKLEETAQTIYKQWFVDFEFPNENGEPYKSTGGEMEYNKELDREIPAGWEVIPVKKFCVEMKSGGTPDRGTPEYWNSRDIPWLKTGELSNKVLVEAEEYISNLGCKNSSAKKLPINSVLIAMYGEGNTKGQVGFLRFEAATNQACCAMICENAKKSSYLYYFLRINRDEIANMANGGAQPNLSKALIEDLRIIKPTAEFFEKHPFVDIINIKEVYTREDLLLQKAKDLLLSKLATVTN